MRTRSQRVLCALKFERYEEENEAMKLKCEAFQREIDEELKPKCEHLEQGLSVAQEEVSGQFQLGVEHGEAQRKLAETEQALEAMRAERDIWKSSSLQRTKKL